MQKFYDISQEKQKTAVALGFFDGLHKGHRNVILQAVRQKSSGLLPVCFTFSQSPKSVLLGTDACSLMTEKDKTDALSALGIEHMYEADFLKLKDMTAEDFFSKVLVKKLNAKQLFCGFNYRFGKNGEGDAQLLESLCNDSNVGLTVVEPQRLNGEVISSTLIRNMISEGKIKTANAMLGSLFGFSTVIEHGRRLGRTIGKPTINQPLCSGLVVPKFGVYVSEVTLESGEKYCGVTNIGVKPTVGGTRPLSETWMPKYKGEEIYGQTADIRLIDFIRAEKKFDSIEELKNVISDNGNTALKIYGDFLNNFE